MRSASRLTVSCVVLLLAGSLALAERPPGGSGKGDGVEDVETVEVKPAPAAVPHVGAAQRVAGRLHASVVHLPIGWLLLLLLLEGLSILLRKPAWQGPCLVVLIAAVASFIPAAVSGFLRLDELGQGSTELALLGLRHRNLMLIAAALCGGALLLRLVSGPRTRGWQRGVYLMLIGAGAAVVTIAGHLGGRMVHGSDFLPF